MTPQAVKRIWQTLGMSNLRRSLPKSLVQHERPWHGGSPSHRQDDVQKMCFNCGRTFTSTLLVSNQLYNASLVRTHRSTLLDLGHA